MKKFSAVAFFLVLFFFNSCTNSGLSTDLSIVKGTTWTVKGKDIELTAADGQSFTVKFTTATDATLIMDMGYPDVAYNNSFDGKYEKSGNHITFSGFDTFAKRGYMIEDATVSGDIMTVNVHFWTSDFSGWAFVNNLKLHIQ